MDNLDKIEKIRSIANISYEEARNVLNEAGGDLLDAVILLEKRGYIPTPESNKASEEPTGDEPLVGEINSSGSGKKDRSSNRSDNRSIFIDWVRSLLIKGRRNSLKIMRHGNILASMPVTVFAVALVFAFWVTVPLMITGLFCGCSYSFIGPDLDRENINKAWDKASQMAESIKNDIKREMENNQNNENK